MGGIPEMAEELPGPPRGRSREAPLPSSGQLTGLVDDRDSKLG